MSEGLGSMVSNASSGSGAVKKGIEINILDELGITGRQTAFNMRTMALSQPEEYAKQRDKRFVVLAKTVGDIYDKVRKELSVSGLPINEVLRLASQAAKNIYDTENAILETQFPSGSNGAVMHSAGRSAFPGMLARPQAAPRRAPD